MATIKVCDVCKHEGKMVESKWRSGFKGGWKVDLCDAHKNAGVVPKTLVEFIKWYFALQDEVVDDEMARKLALAR